MFRVLDICPVTDFQSNLFPCLYFRFWGGIGGFRIGYRKNAEASG
jgi:hypothetical protein